MFAKKHLILFPVLALVLAVSACGQAQGATDLPETNAGQQVAIEATDLPTGESMPNETVEAEVDLSDWSQSSLATFSSDNSLLAVYGLGITVYDSASLQQITHLIPDENISILDLAFSLDNKSISAAYNDGIQNIYGVQTFDLSTNSEVNDVVVLSRGDNYQPLDIVTLSPDGKTLALFDAVEGILTLWDVASGEQLHNLNKYAFCLAFSPASNTLAICDYSSFKYEMNFLDLTSGNEVRSIDMLKLYNGPTRVGESVGGSAIYNMRVAFSADGNILAVAALYNYVNAGNFSVTLIDLGNGNELVNFDVPISISMSGNPLFALAFSNDGKLLASGSATEIKIWDTASAQLVQTIDYAVENNSYARYDLLFTPDNTKLISSSEWNYQVILWDVSTGEQLAP
jgi:WD40 repeat protein